LTSPSQSVDPEDLVSLDDLESQRPLPHFEFLTGPAGSGKSFNVMGRVRENPSYGVVCSTTGVSAVNLGAGVTTINSLLRYFDYESLKDNYISGKLNRKLVEISEEDRVDHIILDEVSMMPGPNLELITSALLEVNQSLKRPLGLIVTGDFMQLAPVKAPWAFETLDDKDGIVPSPVWEKYFAPNTVRLDKIWRQSDPLFLTALNGFRRGDGKAGAEALSGTCARFADGLDTNFDGTTILAKNDEVDKFNFLRLNAINGPAFNLGSYRWASEPRLLNQWGEIPEKVMLKRGALVMVLANHPPDFEYVNGDLAAVEEFDAPSKSLILTLKRNGEEIYLPPLLRKTHQRETPECWKGIRPRPRTRREAAAHDLGDASYWDSDAEKWVAGEVYYYPVRLGWATTVHKSQSLSLDRVQVDARNNFFRQPGLCYVSISRCRTPEGLRIVGSPKLLEERCNIDEKVRPWL
jgi:hypothetical protein